MKLQANKSGAVVNKNKDTKKRTAKLVRGYSPCGKRYAAMLFRGLCLGQTGHAGDRFYCAALAQKVDALKTFQYAALFGRRGASAFETAVLGHKHSPSYKINIKSVIKRRLFQIATFFLPLTNLFYSPKKIDCLNIFSPIPIAAILQSAIFSAHYKKSSRFAEYRH